MSISSTKTLPVTSQLPYVTQPPAPVTNLPGVWKLFVVWRHDFLGAFRHLLATYSEPNVSNPPVQESVDEEIVENCRRIYERSLSSRQAVEEKAKTTFGIVSTLWPILSAGLIFLLAHPQKEGGAWIGAVALLILAIVFLTIAFFWTSRTTAVKQVQALGIESVLDRDAFRKYSASFDACGLIYCASWNDAMNARYAQFVRYARAMIVSGVLFTVFASMPLASIYTATSSSGELELQRREDKTLQGINALTVNFAGVVRGMSHEQANAARIETLQASVTALGAQLKQLEGDIHQLQSPRDSRGSRTPKRSRRHGDETLVLGRPLR